MAVSHKTTYRWSVVEVQFIESPSVLEPQSALTVLFHFVLNVTCALLKVLCCPAWRIPLDSVSYTRYSPSYSHFITQF